MTTPSLILVLEDETYRVDFFRDKFAPALITADPRVLVERLRERAPEVATVYLDHELGIMEYTPYPRELTGRDAASAIDRMVRAEGFDLSHVEFVIHSMNPPGAARIALALTSAGLRVRRVPFFDLARAHGMEIWTASVEDVE